MIQINDNDLPITAAEKIIRGVKPNDPTPLMKSLAKAITGDEHANDSVDMFDLEEIKEIADHLIVYYESHKFVETNATPDLHSQYIMRAIKNNE